MTESDSKYTVLYSENPNTVKMLCYDDGKQQARALVWKTECCATIVDRVYPNDGYHVEVFRDYAYRQGWGFREHQHLPDGSVHFDFADGTHRCDFEVVLPESEYLPYIDSFHWGTGDWRRGAGDCWRLTPCADDGYDFRCSSTCGDVPDSIRCDNCNCQVRNDDLREAPDGDNYCESCFDNRFTVCDCCGQHADVSDGESVECDWYCAECREDHLFSCTNCGEWSVNDDMITADDGEAQLCSCCGEDTETCAACGESYTEDCRETYTDSAGDEVSWCNCCAPSRAYA